MPQRTAVERGVTLVETLLALLVAVILVTAVSSVGFRGLQRTRAESLARTADSNTVQFSTGLFVGDVRQTVALANHACTPVGVTPLLTMAANGASTLVAYGTAPAGDGTANVDLIRSTCTPDGPSAVLAARVETFRPGVTASCDASPCDPAIRPRPRSVRLVGTAAHGAPLDIEATTRSGSSAAVPPPGQADILSLGGNKPIVLSGNALLSVDGAIAVASNRHDAIKISGNNARITAGSMTLQPGAGCSGCDAVNTSPFPPTFGVVPSDPFAYMPRPDEAGLPVHTADSYQGPGVYTSLLRINSGTTLAPGTYILRSGMQVTGGAQVSGTGVFLFNGCGIGAPATCASTGTISVSSQAMVSLTPHTTGRYAGLLIFQDRGNTKPLTISGGGQVVSLEGVIYAPSSSALTLGAGGGGITIGGIVGTNLDIKGNGTVTVR